MNNNILMETNHLIHLTQVWICLFLIETSINIAIDSHQDQQLESDLNIIDQFRNVLFPGKIWKRTGYNTLPEPARALYDPTAGLESGRLVDHLGLARGATQ